MINSIVEKYRTIEHHDSISLGKENDSINSEPQHNILANIGIFDEMGDFYFKNDNELINVQTYFSLFFENRVEFSRNTQRYNTLGESKVLKKIHKPSCANSKLNQKPLSGYQKYLSKSKHKNLNIFQTYREVKDDEETAPSCEVLPSSVPQTQKYAALRSFTSTGFKF